MESLHDLEVLIESGKKNLLIIETEREGCFMAGFERIASRSMKQYFNWTITKGLCRMAPGFKPQLHNRDPDQLFAQIQETTKPSVYILIDFHPLLTDARAIRHIKDVLINSPQHTLVLLSVKIDLPFDLQDYAAYYSLPLPTKSELQQIVKEIADRWYQQNDIKVKATDNRIAKRLIENLCGLSVKDAKRLAEHAIFTDGVIDQDDIAAVNLEKFKLLNKDDVLNYELDYELLDNIAGFDNLKKWLDVRRQVFHGELKLPGGDIPKGMLLLGVQGCGKSLAAKAVAGSWQLPLLHLDFASLYNKWVGQTEENLRNALETAEKMEPCVLWIDEIEKGLSAVSSSDDTSKRLLGTFLTWLAENDSKVFIVATANDVTALPPELLRKGRFDEVFFVDLPEEDVRRKIVEVHLNRRELSSEKIDTKMISQLTEGFSGAEIEQALVDAIYRSYAKKNDLNTGSIVAAVEATRPLSVLMAEKVHALRSWAEERAVKV